ncbi:MAG: glutamate racemase, partial [Gemmatimonadales bacterium]
AVQATTRRRVGVMGTAGTIASGAYQRAIRALDPSVEVRALACPLLVPLVEEGWFEHPAARLIADEYLAPLKREVDVLVLGCTHYPLLKPMLAEVMGPGVALIDSAEKTAEAVEQLLASRGLARGGAGAGDYQFVVSDDEPHFRNVGARFLGDNLRKVEVVPLG